MLSFIVLYRLNKTAFKMVYKETAVQALFQNDTFAERFKDSGG